VISIVLAAGKGKRMGSPLPKVLHQIKGRPMICYVLDAARAAGAVEHCVVVGHGADEVISAIRSEDIIFAEQSEQKGTGHAVLCAGEALRDCKDSDVLILCGDTPCLKGETLKKFCDYFLNSGDDLHVLSTIVDEPGGYGRIIRDESSGEFREIREDADLYQSQRLIREINTGIYAGKLPLIFELLSGVKDNNAQGEYYLTDIVSLAVEKGFKVQAVALGESFEFTGVNTIRQLDEAAAALN
jgi:bifunctional UDP-N-acetylglucosamine pyrophosphorylase/glucosamine-1-phosphate N-acetyltransferase